MTTTTENTEIRNWYKETYPTDELGEEINPYITFMGLFEAMDNYENVYDYIGVYDSIVRENIFTELSNIMKVDYNYVYEQWLKCN